MTFGLEVCLNIKAVSEILAVVSEIWISAPFLFLLLHSFLFLLPSTELKLLKSFKHYQHCFVKLVELCWKNGKLWSFQTILKFKVHLKLTSFV